MTTETVKFSGPIRDQSLSTRKFSSGFGGRHLGFSAFKRFVDLVFSVGALPVVAMVAVVLLILNPFLNPGSLFFRQERMGQGGKRFAMWKFRTMLPDHSSVRGHDDPLEEHRITTLGRFLRKTRIDELPNAFNVLTGDMSLIGPRPDAFAHASEYIRTVPHYRVRLRVRPGITGLAQVRGGYADTDRAIRLKARLDRYYVDNANGGMEMYIIGRTVFVMLTGFGAR